MQKNLIKYWEGKSSLAQSYWIGCIIIPVVLVLPILPAFDNASNISGGYAAFALAWWGALFFVNMFLFIGAFKSATIYIVNKKKKKQGSGWGIAAKIFIVLGAISVVFQYLRVFAG